MMCYEFLVQVHLHYLYCISMGGLQNDKKEKRISIRAIVFFNNTSGEFGFKFFMRTKFPLSKSLSSVVL